MEPAEPKTLVPSPSNEPRSLNKIVHVLLKELKKPRNAIRAAVAVVSLQQMTAGMGFFGETKTTHDTGLTRNGEAIYIETTDRHFTPFFDIYYALIGDGENQIRYRGEILTDQGETLKVKAFYHTTKP